MRQLLQKAGITNHTESPKLATMVAAFTHTTTSLVIIIEPADLEKLAKRILAAATGKTTANIALLRIAAEAKSFEGRKAKAYEQPRRIDPTFIVVAKARIDAKHLPAGVKSFAIGDEAGILDALRAAANPRNS